ncbi:MAG: glycoside hydrolase family 3 C-terminal domain-containing protein [Prevotellaceae bacterium]|jgi:beta-glucosidase-like glycosyl hydrolase/regulation of enolase protein 1 (concanavalin A-like superfamily)|nr:glycoside hydrolase family 3 C-terminal domain-containing protein [Prevotellaceae bacterium]
MTHRRIKQSLTGLCVLAGVAALTAFRPADDHPIPVTQLPIYQNTAYSFEERAADLVSRFTLEEKQSLLGNSMAAVPRLGIKAYNVWSEALHGILGGPNPSMGLSSPTSFPNSVAIGSTWDPELAKRMASAITDEARAIFGTGTKGLTYWSPVVEPIRDPRWGRTGESYGEDPFLVRQIASGFVQGFMGDDPTYLKAVPTAKHYFANNSEFDRHVSSSNMDGRDMREFYLAPYKYLIEEDKLPSIMTSYNAVNGVPTSASRLYLDSIARRTYGMKGYITGDCAAIEDIYTGHYYAKTGEEATAYGLMAGVDSDCGSVYQRFAILALQQGILKMEDIDRALINMFTVRMRTGEFDPQAKVPYSVLQPNVVNSPGNRALARELATKTPVLLKNVQQILPLDPAKVRKIAVLGPQSNEVELGPYSGRPEQANMITPLAGIQSYVKARELNVEVTHASGGSTKSKSNLLYVANFSLKKANGSVSRHDATKYSAASPGITVGSGMGAEEQVRTIDDGSWTAYENIDLVNVDSITVGINIPTEGGIVEIHTGSPEGQLLGTIEATAASGKQVGGVYGQSTPMKAKINRMGFTGAQTLYLVYKAPEDDAIDPKVIEAAKAADVAIVFVGTDEKTATEEADRLTLLLPGNQPALIKAVAAVNPRTIVVMQTLGCVEVDDFKDLQNIPGILWVGYNGQAQGDAIAEVLFGDINPGGKLNATWYKSLADLPAITDYTLRGDGSKNGRTLWYFDKPVSYEFGYGLSYTTFAYKNFRISRNTMTPNDQLTVSVDVTNTGQRDGDEVVQLYVSTPDAPASLQRPIKRLKGFERVTIPAGQTRTVCIPVDCADLWFWDMKENRMMYDAGRYIFEVGASSKDIRGTLSATMSGSLKPRLKLAVVEGTSMVMTAGQTGQSILSASMTDDSFYDLSKATVTYTSNNTGVATVDANGTVTAVAPGVATIYASVTIDGITCRDSYPVKVMPNLNIASITVDGKAVPGFKADVPQYSYLLKAGAATPVVKATAADAAIAVETIQAQAVPGTAVVSLKDSKTNDAKSYVINFGVKGTTDQFDKAALAAPWHWVRDNATFELADGKLTLTASKGDIADTANEAHVLLQSANTDWTIETKLTCEKRPSGFAQNAGLVAYQDDDNFVKLTYRAAFSRRGGFGRQPQGEQPGSVELMVESNGQQKTAVTLSMEEIITSANTLVLRLVKKGDAYTAYVSPDGKKFKEVGAVNYVLKDIQVGLLACEGVMPAMMRAFMRNTPQNAAPQPPFKVSFDYFKIKN